MINIKNKQGDVNWFLIITLVIVASFAVLLIFLYQLNLGGIGNKEICHNSVVLKTTNSIGSLNCKTDYVCISGGGKCSDITPSIIENVNPDNKNEIFKAIADQMANCWWMFDEGKRQYVDVEGIKGTGCAICSVIKFDDKVKDAYATSTLSYKEFLDYLGNTVMETASGTSQQTYLNYLYDVKDLNSLFSEFPFIADDYNNKKIYLFGEKYMIRTGQSKFGFSNIVIRFLFGNPKVYNIYPYLVPIGDKAVTCNEYETKA